MLEQSNAMQEQARADAKKEFLGFSWGVGAGAVINLGEDDRVETAEVVDGIVRVTKEANDTARVFAEVHLFRPINKEDTKGHGPFVAIQSSANDLIDSFSVGYMRGWRKDANATNSINVGFGLVLDTNVKELGNGIEEDQPLPPGENADSVRLKETSGLGLGIFVSFSY